MLKYCCGYDGRRNSCGTPGQLMCDCCGDLCRNGVCRVEKERLDLEEQKLRIQLLTAALAAQGGSV